MPRKSKVSRTVGGPAPAGEKCRVRRTPEVARQLILDAARAVIRELGPDKVGLREVAARAGISHALVGHYFGTYESLVDEVMVGEVRQFRESVLTRLAAEAKPPSVEWISDVLAEYTDPARSRLMVWAVITGRLARPDAPLRKEQGLRKLADAIEARLRAGEGSSGLSRSDLETTLIVAISAAWGYAVASDALWAALGRSRTASFDDAVRSSIAAAIKRELTPRRSDGSSRRS